MTGNVGLVTLCSNQTGVLRWQVNNVNGFDISFVWWVVGGSATGGPISVPAASITGFQTPVDGALPNNVAIMWYDPGDSTFKTVSGSNAGVSCDEAGPTPTPTATPVPGVLIPVTGIELPEIFRESMFLNMGIGIFGFALILLGIGIRLDRDKDEEDE
ncbi:MAG: hypothetical protein O3B43_01820 [Chloroflexi bacterium]|nr:hypothetical protein [Chloroflexota bacterium]